MTQWGHWQWGQSVVGQHHLCPVDFRALAEYTSRLRIRVLERRRIGANLGESSAAKVITAWELR
jgi:hypothetical protein